MPIAARPISPSGPHSNPYSIRRHNFRASGYTTVALLPLMLAACVGGGGGGGPATEQPALLPANDVSGTAHPVPGAETFETQEYKTNRINPLLNASSAYARGHTGAGVTVGIVDGLLDPGHRELAGRVLSVQDFTGGAGRAPHPHGMAVAGIVAAARDGWGVHGVAFDSTLRSYGIINDNGTVPYDGRVAAAFTQAANDNVRILNNSWGGYGGVPTDERLSMDRLVREGSVLVWAAGNGGGTQPTAQSRLPVAYQDLEKGWLVVTSVNADLSLSSFSDHCGDAANWCLSAPGDRVVSIGTTSNSLVQGSGTSFAAPAVSGALAVLMEAFPHLTPQQARAILLQTATPLGDPRVFGRGLVDLERATRPVGDLSVPTGTQVDGPHVSPEGAALGVAAAMGDGPARAMGGAPVMVLDAYQRPYLALLDAAVPTVAENDRDITPARMARFGDADVHSVQTLGDSLAFGLTSRPHAPLPTSRLALRRGDMVFNGEAGYLPADTAALSGLSQQAARLGQGGVGHPYLGLMTSGTRFSAQRNSVALSLATADGGTVAGTATWRPLSGHDLRLALGTVREPGAVLGASGAGALAVHGTTTTTFASAALRRPLGDGWSLLGGMHVGHTSLAVNRRGERSLVAGFGGLSTAGAVSLERTGALTSDGVLSFTVSQPLRMESGGYTLDRPVARTLDGGVVRQRTHLGAVPSSREVALELGWSGSLGEGGAGGRLSASVQHRLNPGHRADAPAETAVMGRWRWRF